MDGHRGYLENGSVLLHESVSDGRIYGFPNGSWNILLTGEGLKRSF